jgi:hypothetical protein
MCSCSAVGGSYLKISRRKNVNISPWRPGCYCPSFIPRPSFRVDQVSVFFPTGDGPVQIQNVTGELKLLFSKDLKIPTVTVADPATLDLIPNIAALSKSVLVDINVVANPKDHPNSIVTTVNFSKNTTATQLDVILLSTKVDYVDFRFTSVQAVTTGLSDPKADIKISGSCVVQQKTLNVETLKVDWTDAKKCTFFGTYDKTGKGGLQVDYLAKGK